MEEKEVKNSSNCDNDCSSCDVDCSQRQGGIPKLQTSSLNNIKKIIGVISGKGGVGKSFVTSLIASRLNKLGYKVGILDGDITGPSIPQAFNLHQGLEGDGHSLIYPLETKSGIKVVSSNLLLNEETDPIIWRGTLISSLLSQFYSDVLWQELDYLLIDMPPGTGDVTLTCFQQIPLDGVILVSTPQDLVSMIVTKQLNMAKMMNINVLGCVLNMSYIKCPDCGKKIKLFGDSKLNKISQDENLDILGELELNPTLTTFVDKGMAEEINNQDINEVVDKVLKKENL